MNEEYIKYLVDRLTHQEEMTEKAMEMAHTLMGKLKPQHPLESHMDKIAKNSSWDKKPWVGLTDEEIKKIIGSDKYSDLLKAVVQTVETKLRENNT